MLLILLSGNSYGQSKTEAFTFEYDGFKYWGEVDIPVNLNPKSMVIIIPGSGRTDFTGNSGWSEWYTTLRQFFVKQGLSVGVWDKRGCGKSEGEFDSQQPVENSANEAIAAIQELKKTKLPGTEQIGLWGISRAGWICPLIINKYPAIEFWISVSGVDSLENSNYLLQANLKAIGRPDSVVNQLMNERLEESRVFRQGGTFDEFLGTNENLRKDSLYIRLHGLYTRETYERDQKSYLRIKDQLKWDERTGSMVFLPGFQQIVESISCPVLAILGEKDSQVDWRRTKSFYERYIGSKDTTILRIKTLPDCNHNIMKCETGGKFEDLEKFNWETCDGYFETMGQWLAEIGITEKTTSNNNR